VKLLKAPQIPKANQELSNLKQQLAGTTVLKEEHAMIVEEERSLQA
jgi:hypothetical protein